jgi:hypothetical protein
VAGDGPLGHVAIDGKRLRGGQHQMSPGVHMLQAFSTRLQAAVGSLSVAPDGAEAVEASCKPNSPTPSATISPLTAGQPSRSVA